MLSGLLARPWVLWLVLGINLALLITLLVLGLRREARKVGRQLERLEQEARAHEATRRMLDAASDPPPTRSELTDRLRDGSF
ncbi:MAG: hypothetical protein ACPGUC_09870 [Gammaproteobacteria bacterium]